MSLTIDNDRFRNLLHHFPEKAIQNLYELHFNSLVVISAGLTHDRNVAKDIVHETFIHVWENRVKLCQDHEQSIQHYLVRVIRNKSMSYFKFNRKVRDYMRNFFIEREAHLIEYSAEATIIEAEKNSQLWKVIASFPRSERECLLMRISEEMHTGQIAERLGITTKAVERSLTSANKRLRKYVNLFK